MQLRPPILQPRTTRRETEQTDAGQLGTHIAQITVQLAGQDNTLSPQAACKCLLSGKKKDALDLPPELTSPMTYFHYG